MAKVVDNELKNIAGDKLVFGTDENLKLLRSGKLSKVFLASNCSDSLKSDFENLCKISNVEYVVLSDSNEEIGVICKKPFSISVVGVLA